MYVVSSLPIKAIGFHCTPPCQNLSNVSFFMLQHKTNFKSFLSGASPFLDFKNQPLTLVTLLCKNQHSQRKFCYHGNRSNGKPANIGHFQNSRLVFEVKCQLNPPETNFFSRIPNQKTTFIGKILNFGHFGKTLFHKNGPNFYRLTITFTYKILKCPLRMLTFCKDVTTLEG